MILGPFHPAVGILPTHCLGFLAGGFFFACFWPLVLVVFATMANIVLQTIWKENGFGDV